MRTIENYSPRSDSHLQQPEVAGRPAHRPSEPDNVAFARDARIALLEELSYYDSLVAEGHYMEDYEKKRHEYLKGREADVREILGL